jgi:hypothetical protein
MQQFEKLEVGSKFPRPGYENRVKGKDACLMGNGKSGYEMLIFLCNMTNDEAEKLKKGNIEFRVKEDIDEQYLLNVVKFGSNKLLFEFPYDPTKIVEGSTREDKIESINNTIPMYFIL